MVEEPAETHYHRLEREAIDRRARSGNLLVGAVIIGGFIGWLANPFSGLLERMVERCLPKSWRTEDERDEPIALADLIDTSSWDDATPAEFRGAEIYDTDENNG